MITKTAPPAAAGTPTAHSCRANLAHETGFYWPTEVDCRGCDRMKDKYGMRFWFRNRPRGFFRHIWPPGFQ